MTQFTIDWPNELMHSAVWTLEVWVVAMLAFVLVVAAVIRLTAWGGRFWSVVGGFFAQPATRTKAWALVALMMLVSVAWVRIDVVFTYQFADLLNAVQAGAEALAVHDVAEQAQAQHMFWVSFAISGVLVVLTAVVVTVDLFLKRVFALRWRTWLNERLTGDWLAGRAFYRTRFLADQADNPDQRIQMDVENITTKATALTMGTQPTDLTIGSVKALLRVVCFSQVLWGLSAPVTVFGLRIPHALVFIAFAYAVAVSAVAFWVGKPLVKLNFVNESRNASYRYRLVRLRDSAEQVAFYQGEKVEQERLRGGFSGIVANMWQIIGQELRLTGWNTATGRVTSGMLTFLVQGPRVFAGQLTTGGLFQSHAAFGSLCLALEYFRANYEEFTLLSASVLRVSEMLRSDEQARALPRAEGSETQSGLVIERMTVLDPGGAELIAGLDLQLAAGEALLVKGRSGCGKTTLLRAVAQLWPYAHGTCGKPARSLFLPQAPYLPLGDLRNALTYPQDAAQADSKLTEALEKVGLGRLTGQLGATENWSAVLSPGEQQRVSFARALLFQPDAVILDEATSALDEELERKMYQLIRSELPETTLVSVGHRSTLDQWHDRTLELEGNGRWRLR